MLLSMLSPLSPLQEQLRATYWHGERYPQYHRSYLRRRELARKIERSEIPPPLACREQTSNDLTNGTAGCRHVDQGVNAATCRSVDQPAFLQTR